MPNIDTVLSDFKTSVLVPLLAPFQPQILPSYPNTDPRAGTISPTLIITGHPIQLYMLERLENKQCVVAIYADKSDPHEVLMPYINQAQYSNIVTLSGTPPDGIAYKETGMSVRRIFVEVWAWSHESREAIGDVIRPYLTDAFRVNHASDGQISLFVYRNQIDYDNEQTDTIYVRRFNYECSFTTTVPFNVTEVLEAQARLVTAASSPDVAGTATLTEVVTTATVKIPPWDIGYPRP